MADTLQINSLDGTTQTWFYYLEKVVLLQKCAGWIFLSLWFSETMMRLSSAVTASAMMNNMEALTRKQRGLWVIRKPGGYRHLWQHSKQWSLLRKYYTTISRCSSTMLAILEHLGTGLENIQLYLLWSSYWSATKHQLVFQREKSQMWLTFYRQFLFELPFHLESFIR